jgi:dihydroxyacetone kinase-like protein
MKKLINNPKNVVHEMLLGLSYSNSEIKYIQEYEVIARKNKKEKVGLVSGGGSGHEPAHAGYVGEGMLDAAVAGNVFASPSPDRIICGIEEADSGKGVLLIVKNYSGDIMNFELAMDLANDEGKNVEMVIVKDDVATQDDEDYKNTGRRGIAGTVFVHKVAGAEAERGSNIKEVKRVAQKAIDNVRTMGLRLTGCTIPEVGDTASVLSKNEIEIGMGIHGEPGVEKIKIQEAKKLVRILIDKIISDIDYENRKVAMMVNGMGGTPLMEMYIVCKEAKEYLDELEIRVEKIYVGNFMTSIEMSGCSISLLRLDDELENLLYQPCKALAFKEV